MLILPHLVHCCFMVLSPSKGYALGPSIAVIITQATANSAKMPSTTQMVISRSVMIPLKLG